MVRYISKLIAAIGIAGACFSMIFYAGLYTGQKRVGKPTAVKETARTIAVVNMDQGIRLEQGMVNYGTQLLSLTGHHFYNTSLEVARSGIENGKFAAYIIVPVNFSQKVWSINTTPEKSILEYAINPNLQESIVADVLYDIKSFETALNTDISYLYLYSILQEFHEGQVSAETIMKNDKKDWENLNSINPEELLQPLVFVESQPLGEYPETMDLAGGYQNIAVVMEDLGTQYDTYISWAKQDLDGVLDKGKRVTEAMDSFRVAISDINLLEDMNGEAIYEEGKQALLGELAGHNAALTEEREALTGKFQWLARGDGAATPSDATPSDATPSDATPSDATSSDAVRNIWLDEIHSEHEQQKETYRQRLEAWKASFDYSMLAAPADTSQTASKKNVRKLSAEKKSEKSHSTENKPSEQNRAESENAEEADAAQPEKERVDETEPAEGESAFIEAVESDPAAQGLADEISKEEDPGKEIYEELIYAESKAMLSEAAPEAAPSEAAPSEAAPSEAAPSEAAPSEAAPSEAAPSEAAPSEATPSEATPSEPKPDPDWLINRDYDMVILALDEVYERVEEKLESLSFDDDQLDEVKWIVWQIYRDEEIVRPIVASASNASPVTGNLKADIYIRDFLDGMPLYEGSLTDELKEINSQIVTFCDQQIEYLEEADLIPLEWYQQLFEEAFIGKLEKQELYLQDLMRKDLDDFKNTFDDFDQELQAYHPLPSDNEEELYSIQSRMQNSIFGIEKKVNEKTEADGNYISTLEENQGKDIVSLRESLDLSYEGTARNLEEALKNAKDNRMQLNQGNESLLSGFTRKLPYTRNGTIAATNTYEVMVNPVVLQEKTVKKKSLTINGREVHMGLEWSWLLLIPAITILTLQNRYLMKKNRKLREESEG